VSADCERIKDRQLRIGVHLKATFSIRPFVDKFRFADHPTQIVARRLATRQFQFLLPYQHDARALSERHHGKPISAALSGPLSGIGRRI
jgi:hypothetical protein